VIDQLVSLQIVHFICDYPLQGRYMLGKFKPYPDYILPLLAHSLVQGLGTAVLCFFFNWPWWFTLVAVVSHFIIDRLKASPTLGGRWKPHESMFWTALGLDQMAHHLVGIWMFAYANGLL